MNQCLVCGIELQSDKAKTCSPRCRKLLSRQTSVTNNVSVTAEIEPSVTFRFRTIAKAREPLKGQTKETDTVSDVRSAKYWYDVPLGAIPEYEKDWPKMPEYMNGRQYFLWWKNEFKTQEDGSPIIYNPYPVRENVTYVQAGDSSRRWGA